MQPQDAERHKPKEPPQSGSIRARSGNASTCFQTENKKLAALPHEMTHVLLFDLLGGRRPPPWADEGAAILADSETKRQLHARDARDAIRQRTTFQYLALLQCDEYPAPKRIPAFYGQSAFLAATLVSLKDAPTFIDFLEAAKDRGYDQALRDIYGIEGIPALERCDGATFSATNTISALQSGAAVTRTNES